jgi:PAS domain S-box-containing protein
MADQIIRVLLVEDNPADVLLLEEALAHVSAVQFQLKRVERLGEALDNLGPEDFDVCLLDLSLPDSHGLETLVKVRAKAPSLPIVVLTGLADEAFGLSALPAGAQDYLIKGEVEGYGVVHAIRYAIERQRAEEEIRRRNRELSLLNQVIAACATDLEVETILDITCRELALAFEVARVTAMLLNEKKTSIQVVAEHRSDGGASTLGLALPVARNPLMQHLLQYEGPLIINAAQSDPRLALFREGLRQEGVVSMLILPLRFSGEVLGSMSIEATEPRAFPAEDVNLAWSIADQMAGTLARTRLSQTQQRLSAAIEQSNDTVIVTDTADVIVYVNPAFERNSGYSRAEALGQSPAQFLGSGQYDPDFYQEVWATISDGRVWRGRFVNKHKDGPLYIEDATITPIRNDNNAIVNYVSVRHDVTRELQLEEQYRQAQKMEAVGRLSGGIAHDFNNLLVVITGYSELLLERHLSADSPLRKSVEEIKKAGDRAAGLTQQLLAFSRKQVLQPEVLNLNDVVVNIEKMLRRLISEDIDLVTAPGAELGRVKADPGQIEQVILNLAINARDAMPMGGRLTLATANLNLDAAYAREHVDASPGRYVLLAVTDTGIGMDAEVRSHIFEPFFTTKEPGKGTGLGLATVYGIVKQSGGHIQVFSQPGQGTTFEVYLPRIDEAVSVVESSVVGSEPAIGVETVLLVEDEEAVRTLARQVLELGGYTVLEASHGKEALQLSEQGQAPIHLLLTDVIMPGGMNGPELAEQLKPLYPDLKVLFMSGYTNDAISRYEMVGGGLHFLQKPFIPRILLQKVHEILDT